MVQSPSDGAICSDDYNLQKHLPAVCTFILRSIFSYTLGPPAVRNTAAVKVTRNNRARPRGRLRLLAFFLRLPIVSLSKYSYSIAASTTLQDHIVKSIPIIVMDDAKLYEKALLG